jgi:hypothetical protein
MLRQLVDWAASLIFLARDTSENKRAVAELTERVEGLTDQIRDLALEFRLFTEREKHEREKFMLQVENAILRLERRLLESTSKARRKR